MAIKVMPFYAIVLRPFRRNLPPEGWRFLIDQAARGGAYDGEIMVFGAMNPVEAESIADFLVELGYRRFRQGEDAEETDFACFESGVGPMPDWLECVEYRRLDHPERAGEIWKLKNSEAYDLFEFDLPNKPPRKGFEVDWPPFIGKCWD